MAQKVPTEHLHVEDLFSVKGKVAVVTGGGTGIGLMISQAFAANGARVYITSRSEDVLERSAQVHSHGGDQKGQIINAGVCDVTSKKDLQALYERIAAKEDHVDVLVANAGIAGPKADPAGEQDAQKLKERLWDNETVEQWDEVHRADVHSIYFTTVAFLPLLQKANAVGHMNASVITITSMSGLIRHAQGHFAYNAAKGAAVQLTKLMASEFTDAGIRVNSIAPGYFPSKMTQKTADETNKSELTDDSVQVRGHVPTGRAGSDREMAQAAVFLAVNNYVQGQIISVDGGVLNKLAS